MIYKKFILLFLISIFGFIAILELTYQNFRKDVYTNPLEYKVNGVLNNIHNQKFDTIIFSTSVTYGALREYKLNDDVLELGTTSGVGFIGQYYMLKRYLSQNNRVKNIYIFILPGSFNVVNFSPKIFSNNDEINISMQNGMKKVNTNYFYSRISYLKFWNSSYRNLKQRKLLFTKKYSLEGSQLNSFKTNTKMIHMNKIVDTYLNNIIELCKKYKININIVIEPMTEKKYIDYLHSGIVGYLEMKDINLIDINKFYMFKDSSFFDRIHLTSINKKKYAFIINQFIIKLNKGVK